MGRRRMIEPELLTSAQVARLPKQYRFAWVGMILFADDQGRARDDARLFRAHCWALDDDETAKTAELQIVAMTKAGLVCRYVVDGDRYLHLPTWHVHQRVDHPAKAKLPPCPEHEHVTAARNGDSAAGARKAREALAQARKAKR